MELKRKVGDRVKIKSLDWYKDYKSDRSKYEGKDCSVAFADNMSQYCGNEAIIETVDEYGYRINFDNLRYIWNDYMFEEDDDEEGYTLLAYKEGIFIVQKGNEEGFNPFVIKNDNMYYINGKPVIRRYKQKSLNNSDMNVVNTLLTLARAKWDKIKSSVMPPQSSTEPQTTTPQSTLDSLICDAVSKLAVDKVLDRAKDNIDAYIKKEFGVLPKKVIVEHAGQIKEIKGVTHEVFDTALNIVSSNIPLMLVGEAGTGKNVICKQIADALGLEFYFSNAITQEYKLTGFIDAGGIFHETQFYKAFTQGGLFMIDEIDGSVPEVLICLNAAIGNRYFDFPTGKIYAHKDFRIVAAGNTYGTGANLKYTGRYQLDVSSTDRFAVLEVGYDKNIELAMCEGDEELVDFIRDLRESISKSKFFFSISYRAINRIHKMKKFMNLSDVMKICLIKSMSQDDLTCIVNNMKDRSCYYDVIKSFCL